MIKCICDKCGKEIGRGLKVKTDCFAVDELLNVSDLPKLEIDLCPECTKKFLEYITKREEK